ncbi:uncharacterized protein [Rutidosis leptorrhynchoides]|uniref:uncharacterized protein n=1 Tax=Rutidosis leptorrhynchoides TaxID=125765 RepID=UPI003A9A01F9
MDLKRFFVILLTNLEMKRCMDNWTIVVNGFQVILHATRTRGEKIVLRDRIETARLPRQAMLDRLFNEVSRRLFIRNLRMNLLTFEKLCRKLKVVGLKENGHVCIEEQVVMFLFVLAHHYKMDSVGLHFMRSSKTVSRSFHNVLKVVCRLYTELVEKPHAVEDKFLDSRWKWFKCCIETLNGTYLDVRVRAEDRTRYRTCKCHIATNVLGVCAQNMNVILVYPGWKGSAFDSRVLRDTLRKEGGLRVPTRKYYLVDAGYYNAPRFLALHRGTHYHLSE